MEQGRIRLKDVQFDCIVGVLPYERINEQPIILNLTLWLDFAKAAETEDLNESIDYAKPVPGCLGAEASVKISRQ